MWWLLIAGGVGWLLTRKPTTKAVSNPDAQRPGQPVPGSIITIPRQIPTTTYNPYKNVLPNTPKGK